MKILNYILLVLAFSFYGISNAQLVNNGALVSIDKNASIFIDNKYLHLGGNILNNGKMIITNDFVNSSANNVYSSASLGMVSFEANSLSIKGNQQIVFPNLEFKGNGTYEIANNTIAKNSLSLSDSEIKIKDGFSLTLENKDIDALKNNEGFINTTSNNSFFIRKIQSQKRYIFPLGSKNLGNNRFVSVKSYDDSENLFAVALIDKNPQSDGLVIDKEKSFVSSVSNLNYYNIKRIKGSSNIDVSFYSPLTERSNTLAEWQNFNWGCVKSLNISESETIFTSPLKVYKFLNAHFDLANTRTFALGNTLSLNQLVFYNAFSPDGDGANDTWEIKNIDNFPNNELKIFDRSGGLVYTAKNYNSTKFWDGTNVNAGTYIYMLSVRMNNESKIFKGTITIVK